MPLAGADGSALLYIPDFHNLSKGDKVTNQGNGEYEIQDDNVLRAINLLKSMNKGDEVQLFVETTNSFHKDNEDEAAIAVRFNGEVLFYLNLPSSIEKNIEATDNEIFRLRLIDNLAATRALRKAVWENRNAMVTAKIDGLSSGTVIPSPVKRNPLEVVAGSWKLGYADPSFPTREQLAVVGESELFYSTGSPDLYNSDAEYSPGTEYLLVEGFNYDGTMKTMVPLYLQRGALSENDHPALRVPGASHERPRTVAQRRGTEHQCAPESHSSRLNGSPVT